MTDLFTQSGHLTDHALRQLIRGELDEMSRLEVAEHLSFCDACIARYTALLTEDVLDSPQYDATLPVLRKVKRRQQKADFQRIASAVAAVAITGTLWYFGAFDTMGKVFLFDDDPWSNMDIQQSQTEVLEERSSLSNKLLQATDHWSQRILDRAESTFRLSGLTERIQHFNPQNLEDNVP